MATVLHDAIMNPAEGKRASTLLSVLFKNFSFRGKKDSSNQIKCEINALRGRMRDLNVGGSKFNT